MSDLIDLMNAAYRRAYDGNWNKERQIGGMTLRDWFAGQFASAMLSTYRREGIEFTAGLRDELCGHAYWYADAMLKARSDG